MEDRDSLNLIQLLKNILNSWEKIKIKMIELVIIFLLTKEINYLYNFFFGSMSVNFVIILLIQCQQY